MHSEKPIKILIVDDRPENLFALEKILDDLDITIFKAASGNEALALTLEHNFALVLLDVQMPGMDGFETAALMRSNQLTCRLPIVFVTAISTEEKHFFKGYESGAIDYLCKPINPDILKSKVRIFCELHRHQVNFEIANATLQTTLNSINDALFTVTAGTITFANRAAGLLLHCSPEELEGRPLDATIELTQLDSTEKIALPETATVLPSTTPLSGEALLHHHGTTLMVEYKFFRMIEEHADPNDMVFTMTDITEKRGTAAKLSQIMAEQQIILENVMAGILYSQDRKILWVNEMLEQIFKIKREDLEGRSTEMLFPSLEMYEKFEHDAYPQLSNGKGFHTETIMKRTDGSLFWCKITGKEVAQSQGESQGVIWLMEDVSVRKEAEIEREKMRAQLLHAQKMEAIGTLAAGVAHDFNNVLTAIQGYLDLAMLKIDRTELAYKDLERVNTASRRAADLVRQLLLFSRKQPMQFAPVDIKATVSGLLKMLNRFIGEDITIETDIADDLMAVEGDAGNIEQVLMNIAVNARDAMPNGGTLRIKAQNTRVDQEFAKNIPEAVPGSFVSLLISDTGEGINKNVQDHIFEPFFTTKGTGKGTGLGLSVVYGIIKEHNGWILVDSEPNQGTTFSIFLPVSKSKAHPVTEVPVSYDTLQGKGQNILLIEDEEQVRKLAVTALSGNGYAVTATASIQEARDRFEEKEGAFDLIFSDIVLPDGNGLELVSQFRQKKSDLRILLTSGYTGHKSRWTEIKEQEIPFLQKPFTISDLLTAVKEALVWG